MTHNTDEQGAALFRAAYSHNVDLRNQKRRTPAQQQGGRRAAHSPPSALPPTRGPARNGGMPKIRVGDPKEIVVYEARRRGLLPLPRAFVQAAYDLRAARHRGSAREPELEARVLDWCERFDLRENLIEVECCDACGQILPEPRSALAQARVAHLDALFMRVRQHTRALKKAGGAK